MKIIKSSRAISSVSVESKTKVSVASCLHHQGLCASSHTIPDNGDRASLRNIGFWLNTDTADCPRGFYNIHVPWKF
jgi:hypothetical protein